MALNSFNISDTLHHSRRFLLYKASRISDGKQVVIKTQDPAQITDKKLAESLKAEAAHALDLDHPNIRKALGCFEEGLGVYFVAAYAEGKSLGEILLDRQPDAIEVLTWAKGILAALLYAEGLGLIHENLNPYNVVIDSKGNSKLIGFGKNRPAWQHSEGNFKYPLPILYVAPEIFNTSHPHANSDLYSWAVMVYQAICGQMPWKLDSFSSPEEQKHQSFSRAILMPDVGKMPDWLYGILLNCMKLDPSERPESSQALLELLQSEAVDFDWSTASASEDAEIIEAELPENIDDGDHGTTLADADLEPGPPLVQISALDAPKPDSDLILAILDKAETEMNVAPNEVLELEPVVISPITVPEPDSSLITAILEKADANLKEFLHQKEQSADLGLPDARESIDSNEEKPIFAALKESLDSSDDSIFELNPAMPDPEIDGLNSQIPEEATSEPEEEIQTQAEHEQEPVYIPQEPVKEVTAKTEAIETTGAKPEPKYEPFRIMDDDTKDLNKMKMSFRILMILSLLIGLYVVVQYVVLRERPSFEIPEPEIELDNIGQVELEENHPIDMQLVPADTLVMGSISPEAKADEFPLLTVPLKSFMISSTEITQKQWNMVFEDNPSLFRGDDLPVENVSFYDAIEFCNAKSLKDGLDPAYNYAGSEIVCDFNANGYRLPTEAEWEFAAKGGDGMSFLVYSGSDHAPEVAWYAQNSGAKSRKVATKQPNALGIYDMSGNVAEWVWNWYTPYSHRISDLYKGPDSGTDKAIRGGSWYHGDSLLRNTARLYAKPFAKSSYFGFRVARSR